MKPTDQPLDPAVVRRQANEWFHRQCEISARCLGPSWPAHQAWIEDYLKEELRERLLAMGWVRKT